jgi:hypothetical protein
MNITNYSYFWEKFLVLWNRNVNGNQNKKNLIFHISPNDAKLKKQNRKQIKKTKKKKNNT